MAIITNEAQAADIRARDNALREWMDKRNSYRQEELPPHINPPTNEERSAVEVFEFMRDRPNRYFVYVRVGTPYLRSATVTTWTGDILGHGTMGAEYRSNMGDKRRSIRFRAITGDTYAGTYYYGAGDYARVRKVKG